MKYWINDISANIEAVFFKFFLKSLSNKRQLFFISYLLFLKLFRWLLFSLSGITISFSYLPQHQSSENILDFFDLWGIHALSSDRSQSYQRFQGIKFMDRPVPETLVMFCCVSTRNGVCVCIFDERIKHSFQSFFHKTQQKHSICTQVWFLSQVSVDCARSTWNNDLSFRGLHF